jgi:hypothetical protein
MKTAGAFSCAAAAILLAFAATDVTAASAPFTPNRTAEVMTQNLYLGTDVSLLVVPSTLPDLIAAVTFALQQVQFTNFGARGPRVAAAIAAAGPALVGLQEVAKWSTGSTPDTPNVQFDYLEILLDALEADGAHYAPVAIQTNIDAVAPGLDENNQMIFVRLIDRVVLLARTDLPAAQLKVSNLQTGTFRIL